MVAFLKRLCIILFCYVLCCILFSLLLSLSLGLVFEKFQRLYFDGDFVTLSTLMAIIFSTLPFLVASSILEILKLRSLWIYVILGLFLPFAILVVLAGSTVQPSIAALMGITSINGAIVGILYWLLAGRNAGKWLDERTSE